MYNIRQHLVCSSQQWPQDDLYAAGPPPPWLPGTVHFKRPDRAERNPEPIQSPTREGSLSGRVSSAAEALTFLVGIHFIYGTSLLIMKLNTAPGESTFFTWGLRAFRTCAESVSVCVFKRLRSRRLGTDGVTALRITCSVCAPCKERRRETVDFLFFFLDFLNLGIAQNSLLLTQPDGFKVNAECVCRESCVGLCCAPTVCCMSQRGSIDRGDVAPSGRGCTRQRALIMPHRKDYTLIPKEYTLRPHLMGK